MPNTSSSRGGSGGRRSSVSSGGTGSLSSPAATSHSESTIYAGHDEENVHDDDEEPVPGLEPDDDDTTDPFDRDDDDSIGDGGDSDIEGEEVLEHTNAARASLFDRMNEMSEDGRINRNQHEVADEFDDLIAGDRVFFDYETTDLKIHRPPQSWTPKPIIASAQEPPFDEVDNPGEWPEHVFQPKFTEKGSSKKHSHHELPAGLRVVPQDLETGKRTAGDYEFIYDGSFDQSGYFLNPFRPGSDTEGARSSSLDINKLIAHGLALDTLHQPGWWHQLVLPFCDPSKSGINGDGRKGYYQPVTSFTAMYMAQEN